DVVYLRAIRYPAEDIEVRGRLSKAIPHIRYRIRVTSRPWPRYGGSTPRRTRRRGCRRRGRRYTSAYVGQGHRITRAPCVRSHFAYDDHNGLPVINVNLERLFRNWTAT